MYEKNGIIFLSYGIETSTNVTICTPANILQKFIGHDNGDKREKIIDATPEMIPQTKLNS